MPLIIESDSSTTRLSTLPEPTITGYKEWYPNGLDFKPGSETHEFVKSQILDRARRSELFLKQRHSDWAEIDRMVTAYIPLSEFEERVKSQDSRKPVSIVVPESYAVLETLLTYLLAVYSGGPLIRIVGTGPEDIVGGILLELLLEAQTKRSKLLLSLHTMWRDAFCYGFGALGLRWETRTCKQPKIVPQGYFDPYSGAFVPTGFTREFVDGILFEGTVADAIDPYRYLPDPMTDVYKPQSGEYVGWIARDSYMSLLRREQSAGSVFFNVEYLRNRVATSCIYQTDASGRNDKSGIAVNRLPEIEPSQPVDIIYMYVDLIPKEWKLGKGTSPEKWMFALAGDNVIIAAMPLDLNHNMFPVVVCAPDAGGHEVCPLARLETMYGIQEGLNFYYNSHMQEVRRGLLNRIIYDPRLLRQTDVESENPWIRTRREVWGRGVKDAFEQIAVTDLTRNHMQDMLITRDVARNVTGAVDSLQGLQRTRGERVTKAEFMETRSAALSRLQKAAQIISLQAMYDLGLMYAYHTQQFMSQETYVSTVGRWEQVLREEYQILDPRVVVNPLDVSIAFDIDISDSSIEGGEYADNWVQLWQIMQSNPELIQNIDATRVFLHIARLMKARDANEFIRKVPMQAQTVPNETAMTQADAGNMMPVGGQASAI